MSGLVLVHLYPRELGINGDVGNVTALRRRAGWRGVDVRVIDVAPGEELPAEAHLVHVGSGPASARRPLHADLARHSDVLLAWAGAGVPFLGISAGWQLLGRDVVELDGSTSSGAGVLPTHAVLGASRIVGEVAGESELGDVAGFVNHNATTTIEGPDAGALARIDTGVAAGAVVGVVSGASIGTDLHGPFLPMNPLWADRLLDAAAAVAGLRFAESDPRIAELDDRAQRSRDAIRARL